MNEGAFITFFLGLAAAAAVLGLTAGVGARRLARKPVAAEEPPSLDWVDPSHLWIAEAAGAYLDEALIVRLLSDQQCCSIIQGRLFCGSCGHDSLCPDLTDPCTQEFKFPVCSVRKSLADLVG